MIKILPLDTELRLPLCFSDFDSSGLPFSFLISFSIGGLVTFSLLVWDFAEKNDPIKPFFLPTSFLMGDFFLGEIFSVFVEVWCLVGDLGSVLTDLLLETPFVIFSEFAVANGWEPFCVDASFFSGGESISLWDSRCEPLSDNCIRFLKYGRQLI